MKKLCYYLLLVILSYFPAKSYAITNEECLGCHSDKSMTKSGSKGKVISLFVEPGILKNSVHGKFNCVDCHLIKEIPHDKVKEVSCEGCHKDEYEKFKGSIHEQIKKSELRPSCKGCHGKHDIRRKEDFPQFVCKNCHSDSYEVYKDSVHGKAAIKEGKHSDIATCHDCHGGHAIFKTNDPRSSVYHLNLPHTCGKCHASEQLAKKHNIPISNAYQLYMDSIHGRAITKSGLLVSANCTDCHGGHNIRKHTDPKSTISRENVSKTCGKCHAGIVEVYKESIHGKLLLEGNPNAPTCISCHTSHQIQRADVPRWQLEVISECGTCHKESRTTYKDSYHGKITALGFTRVAKCADCHGSHDIQKKSDPRSRVSDKRLIETCSSCHPGANENFVKFICHADPTNKEKYPILFYTLFFMTGLLVAVFGFFTVHTVLLWLPRSWIERLKNKKKKEYIGGDYEQFK